MCTRISEGEFVLRIYVYDVWKSFVLFISSISIYNSEKCTNVKQALYTYKFTITCSRVIKLSLRSETTKSLYVLNMVNYFTLELIIL